MPAGVYVLAKAAAAEVGRGYHRPGEGLLGKVDAPAGFAREVPLAQAASLPSAEDLDVNARFGRAVDAHRRPLAHAHARIGLNAYGERQVEVAVPLCVRHVVANAGRGSGRRREVAVHRDGHDPHHELLLQADRAFGDDDQATLDGRCIGKLVPVGVLAVERGVHLHASLHTGHVPALPAPVRYLAQKAILVGEAAPQHPRALPSVFTEGLPLLLHGLAPGHPLPGLLGLRRGVRPLEVGRGQVVSELDEPVLNNHLRGEGDRHV